MSYDTLVASLSPLARWRLGEATPGTGTCTDAANAINGTYAGSPTGGQTAPAGMTGTAVRFTRASSQRVNVSANAGLDHGDTFTYVAWVKRTAASGNLQILVARASGGPQLYIGNGAGGDDTIILDKSGTGNCMRTSAHLTDTGSWHMIAAVKSGSSSRAIYLDGSSASLQNSVDRTYAVSNQALGIASQPSPGNYSNDTLCEVAIFGTALSGADILALYQAGIANNVTVTPSTASLSLTTFAPTVAATAHQTAVPSTAALTTTRFAPTVTTTDHKVATPSTASLALTAFAPTVTATANKTVTPGTASLTLATFAPTVSATAHVTVTPDPASLTLTTFAPSLDGSDHQVATPDAASLALTAFAPTVVATDHKSVTPTTASLSLTAFAPDVVASDHRVVTPDTASLSLASFAPTVTAGIPFDWLHAHGAVTLSLPAAASVSVSEPTAALVTADPEPAGVVS